MGDTTQLQQVIVNLCTNAVYAVGAEEPGSLTITLKQQHISTEDFAVQGVELTEDDYACVTVSDTGCGMSLEVQERIFEPYFTTKKSGEGTGFGLSIVHGIVRKHRGAITVQSEEGKGTVFTMYFPLLSDAADLSRTEGVKSPVEEEAGHGRILFVDDDQTILSMGQEILESYGYSVITATNGRTAIETFKENPASFDALVTDYSMPEMNGHELIKQAMAVRSEIPAILCSGYMEKVEGEDLSELGHTAYMAKPLDWRELSREIRKTMESDN
jgi:CheY-like chemotaxis protein/anti-sigma regulatory factor (Ser/Thr protein kinase)